MLLADEPEALLETVRSRCQEIPLRPLPQAAGTETLRRRGVADMLATEVAMLSRGRAAGAWAGVADKQLRDARREEQATAARWIASPRYEQLVTAFTLGEQFGKRRSEVTGVVQAAIQLLRQEMIASAQAAGQAGQRESDSSGVLPPAVVISRAIQASLQCLSDLNANVRPRLALEAMVVAWPNSELRDR
jgi:DNA polymerase-3 subunit delta'